MSKPTITTSQTTASVGETPDGVTVPQAARKLDQKEQARLEAQMGYLKKNANSLFVTNEDGQTRTIEDVVKKNDDGSMDLKSIPTIYFKGVKNGNYKVESRSTKLMIEEVHDSTIHVHGTILTTCIEMWKCKNTNLILTVPAKTTQLDLLENCKVEYKSTDADDFGNIVWNHVENLRIEFTDHKEHNYTTGFTQMKEIHPDSDIRIDQFIVRKLEEKIQTERCIRLQNGFLSTEREAVAWDKKNALLKERFIANFLKDSGITINKKHEKKQKPNDPCECGSGKKYKKCCFNKVALTGTEEEHVVDIYKK